MRPITILLISVALLIAGGLAFFSKRLVEGQVARAVKSAEEAESAQVLVAARTIGAGKVLDAGDLRYDKWPKAIASDKNVVMRSAKKDPLKEHIGFVARRDLFEGEPIGASAVFKPDGGNKFSAMLAPGMRAITITITAESAIAGLAVPGDRVDVILTSDVSRFGGAQPGASGEFVRFAAETVLQNVKLLAIDQALTRETGSSKEKETPKAGAVGKTATIEVTPEDAEKLILAGQMGKLSLVLRSVAVSKDSRGNDYTTDVETSAVLGRLVGRGRKPTGTDAAPPPPRTGGDSGGPVIINRGGDRSTR